MIDDNYRTYYEVFVYSFYDSDGDGIGELKGLTENLDYSNDGDPETDTDLGLSVIHIYAQDLISCCSDTVPVRFRSPALRGLKC